MNTPLPGLRAQQQAFEAAVRAAPPTGGTPAPDNGQLCRAPDGGAARLDVYRHAYRARLVGALRDNFEVLVRALGDDAFDALAEAYVAAHPSGQPSIRWFGHRLAAFMDRSAVDDDGLVAHAALADLARMDWALRGAFDAADGPVIGRDALAAVPAAAWPALRLQLHPSVRCVPLQWAVEPAWHVLREQADGVEPELPAPAPLAHSLLVWRRGLETQWRSLADAEAELLQALADGDDFGALCERAAGLVDDADQAVPLVVGALQQWLADGLVSGFSVDG
jgi:hypothetical protein